MGQLLTRKLLAIKDTTVCIYSRDEQKQEKMAHELRDYSDNVRFFVGDVRDKERLKMAVAGCDAVIHTAALKIVPTLEYNPIEAIKTNILGTQNLIESVIETCDTIPRDDFGKFRHRQYPIVKVIALSTDKAVAPVNLYGATKLCLEKLIVAANNYGRAAKFSAVRYGNVAMSRGSVIPKYLELKSQGKALPVTDERMTRFWITLNEAADFVLGCLNTMRGGEVFIPSMKSFRIIDIANAISKNGHELIGTRPGEKIHESIISDDEFELAAFDRMYSRYCIGYNVDKGYEARFEKLKGALTSANFVMPPDELAEKMKCILSQ